MRYRHTQRGWSILLIVAAIAALMLAIVFIPLAGANVRPDHTLTLTVIFATLGAFGLLALGFSSLTIEMDGAELRWFFGPGFWKKRLSLDTVNAVEVIKTPWYCGYGIRLMTDGWLYNVAGSAAVALRLNNRTTVYLGSDQPELLKAALIEAIRREQVTHR